MSKKLKLTPWTPEAIPPNFAGVYQVGFKRQGRGKVEVFGLAYHFYSGAGWINDCSYKPETLSGRSASLTELYGKRDTYFWRGLAVAP